MAMTNIDEIKARAAQLNHPHPTYFSYNAEWATTTILELCGEIERLKSELAEKDAVLEFYSDKSNYYLVDIGRDYNPEYKCYELNEKTYDNIELGTKACEVLQKYRKSEG